MKNSDNIEKAYFTIGEVAEMIEQATSLIRFWGDELPWTKPKYGKGGHRQYTLKEAQEVLKVNYLVKHCGVGLDGVKKAHKERYTNELIAFFESQRKGFILGETKWIGNLNTNEDGSVTLIKAT